MPLFVRLIGFHLVSFGLLCAAEASNVPSRDFGATQQAVWKRSYERPGSVPVPKNNAVTPERELLGRTLFFDTRLSGSNFIACSTCHNPGFAWGDGMPKAIGDGMKTLGRRSPTILNTAWADLLFWDGRAESLEEQALGPILAKGEMNQSMDIALGKLKSIPEYRALFAKAYPGEPIDEKTIARAIATFERTVVSGRAPFDEWIAGNDEAISVSAKRGFDLFNGKAACAKCHTGWNFTDNGFHDIGVPGADKGRGVHLPLEAMQFAFKTPTLRNIDRRAPYLHDGSEPTLESVIDFYDRGGKAKRQSLAPEMQDLHLSQSEKDDLLALLKTFTSKDTPVQIPQLPR